MDCLECRPRTQKRPIERRWFLQKKQTSEEKGRKDSEDLLCSITTLVRLSMKTRGRAGADKAKVR